MQVTNKGVDREAKIIRGYSVMSIGEAKGHGMIVDETTLSQIVALGNADPAGVKTRIKHPDPTHDGFGRLAGKSKNFRIEGEKVVADLHLSEVAFRSPEGDLGTYLMDLAEYEPDTFGASPEIRHTKQSVPGSVLPAMRLRSLSAVAIVDDPATNDGFFSCLSAGVEDMADNALESKLGELTAENELLKGEVARVQGEFAAAQAAVAAKPTELSAGREEAVKAERERAQDIYAACLKAGKVDLVGKFIADGVALSTVQSSLLDVLCSANKPVGDGGGNSEGTGGTDENAKYKAEYASQKQAYLSAGVTEESYIRSRRLDDGLEFLSVKSA